MKKILITGGLGYIGYSLVDQLVSSRKDVEITIIDNRVRGNLSLLFNEKLNAKNITFVEGDILDEALLNRHFKNKDCIIHLAAKTLTPFGSGDYQMFEYVNHWGTANVANAALQNNVKELIYLSSSSVYGHNEDLMNLDSNVNPSTDYARSKYNGENQLKILGDDIKTTIVRSGNVYGYNPSLRLDTVINNFIYKAKFNQLLLLNGNGEESRGFIHINRLVEQIDALVLSNKYKDPIYLLADHKLKVIDIVKEIQKICPSVEYRHVNPERKMIDQRFETSVLPGFEKVGNQDLSEDIHHMYHKFMTQ